MQNNNLLTHSTHTHTQLLLQCDCGNIIVFIFITKYFQPDMPETKIKWNKVLTRNKLFKDPIRMIHTNDVSWITLWLIKRKLQIHSEDEWFRCEALFRHVIDVTVYGPFSLTVSSVSNELQHAQTYFLTIIFCQLPNTQVMDFSQNCILHAVRNNKKPIRLYDEIAKRNCSHIIRTYMM